MSKVFFSSFLAVAFGSAFALVACSSDDDDSSPPLPHADGGIDAGAAEDTGPAIVGYACLSESGDQCVFGTEAPGTTSCVQTDGATVRALAACPSTNLVGCCVGGTTASPVGSCFYSPEVDGGGVEAFCAQTAQTFSATVPAAP